MNTITITIRKDALIATISDLLKELSLLILNDCSEAELNRTSNLWSGELGTYTIEVSK